jgi:hypothetical protein
MNPFDGRAPSLSGPARDIVPIVPSDAGELPDVFPSLYVETGGVLVVVTEAGNERTFNVGDWSVFPLGVRQVKATGTTAAGIHGFVV